MLKTTKSSPKLKFAFAGLRHPHILLLHRLVSQRPDCQIVAAADDESEAASDLIKRSNIKLTHTSTEALLHEMNFDILAIGDCYYKRGQLAIKALQKGTHIIADKPLCTQLEELKNITTLAINKGCRVGLMLDLREVGSIASLREIIRSGIIGFVRTVNILGQHPLRSKQRAPWYFQKNFHGGTINDIGIHAFDLVEWLTQSQWDRTIAARSWNGKAEFAEHFLDCAQIMGKLKNGAGVLADFSYLAPDRLGYDLPQYWRILVHGTNGVAETYYNSQNVIVTLDESEKSIEVKGMTNSVGAHLEDFIADIAGTPKPYALNTKRILRLSKLALEAQFISEQ